MHININTTRAGITEAMQQFAATGLKIHISELDISINPKNDFAITYTEAAK
jgi:endo-1,4-beta-xylanase